MNQEQNLEPEQIWRPNDTRRNDARITAYLKWLKATRNLEFADHESLWQWSVTETDAFWQSIWEYFDVRSPTPASSVMGERSMPGAQWFPGTRVNYVDQVFRHRDRSRPAILFQDESGAREEISWSELERRTASFASALRKLGVVPGDRVAAYLPNRPETIVAFLACAAVGAIWSVCSPDMGSVSVLDRFIQIEPKVLVACDGYCYNGKKFDRRETLAEICKSLPTLEKLILVPSGAATEPAETNDIFADTLPWSKLTGCDTPLEHAWLPFDHPLWIVYSSGTTGVPKAIVHGHGGTLLGMSVALAFHNDLGPSDRYHWYSSSGWIMWNCQIGGLLVGSTVCIFDGNPGYPDLNTLWHFGSEMGVTFFGAGAAFYASCLKAEISPNAAFDLSRVRSVGSTGSPLSPECYEWIYRNIGNGDIWLSPMSGGTDIAGPFIAGLPTLPVYLGEMQCRVLGASVHAFDEAGQAVIDEVGELVCTKPMPCMPLFFWNDKDNRHYLESYFDTYPGIWRHGDWIRITPRGGAIIYGRSDATINRHGIRMGTAELYRAVEAIPEIIDSMVVDLEYLGRPSYMPLFVVLKPESDLEALKSAILARIRTALSARHVPNDIFVVPEIPRTLSGKKLELPIKRLLLGHPLEAVVNPDSMANPSSLQWFVDFAKIRELKSNGQA